MSSFAVAAPLPRVETEIVFGSIDTRPATATAY